MPSEILHSYIYEGGNCMGNPEFNFLSEVRNQINFKKKLYKLLQYVTFSIVTQVKPRFCTNICHNWSNLITCITKTMEYFNFLLDMTFTK